jgi:hypothetical protein
MSFMNTGIGDIFGGAGDIFGGAGDAALDAVTGGGSNLQEVSTDQECGIKCGDCTQGTWDYLETNYSKEKSDEAKTWCLGTGLIDGQSSKTKFGKPCCLPPLTLAELEAKGLTEEVKGTGPRMSKKDSQAKQLDEARALCEGGDERGCAALEAAGVEGYKIRMY